MRDHEAVIRLLHGDDPCSVFDTPDIHIARKRFNDLRYRFDFPFWAAKCFPILHIDDPDVVTNLDLNEDQHHIIDAFLKKLQDKEISRFIITKKGSGCGLSTCVQAYIIWLQLFQTPKHSQTCGLSNFHLGRFKENIARFFNRDVVNYSRCRFNIKDADTSAFFNNFNNPDSFRGIDFGYVHIVDMAKWKDVAGARSERAVCAALSGILLDYRTIIVIEGNVPSPKYNPILYNQAYYADNSPNAIFQHISLSHHGASSS